MLDEFTGCVRALVTCAALWSWIIRLMLMPHVGYPQFHLIQKISEVAAEVGVLWPPQRLIHLHTIKLYWLWLLPFLCVHIVLYLCSPLSFCCCLVLSQCVLCQSISCSHWPFISLIHVSSQRTGSLRGSPPHVQCDQYKGQGPCTQTPPLTKREGLKAGETAWWVKVRVCACLWVCVYSTCVCIHVYMRLREREHCVLKLVNKCYGDLCRMTRVHDPGVCHRERSLQVTQTHTDTRSLPFNLRRGRNWVEKGRGINRDRQRQQLVVHLEIPFIRMVRY